MKSLFKLLSYIGLALTIVPAVLVFKGVVSRELQFTMMLVGMFLWFFTAPLWMESKPLDE